MKRLLKGAISTLLIGLMSIQLWGITVLADEVPTIKVPVEVSVRGDYPYKAEIFDVVLTPENNIYPMPEGSEDGTYILKVEGGSSQYFPEISYQNRGVYEYTIHQEKGNYTRGRYDQSIYKLKVYVTNAEQGGLESTVVLYIDDINTKYKEVKFVNYYDPKVDNGPTKPSNPSNPTNPIESLPVDEVRDVEGDAVFDPFGVLGAYDELIPVGVLPATGTLWWAVPLLALGGILLMIIGRRRGHENEE